MISVEPVPLKCTDFSSMTVADWMDVPWVPDFGQKHLKRIMAWFVFASVWGISFTEMFSDVPILFSFTLLLAIAPFALWTWLSLRWELMVQLLRQFEVWFMIFNFMAYSMCFNLLLQHTHLRLLHIFLDMLYFLLLVPLFALLDALPNDFLHKFKIIYGFNAFFLCVSMVRISLLSDGFENFPFMGVTVKSWWITSTAYSASFNLVAFLLNNLYMSYKHPNDYVLWKVGMRETSYAVKKHIDIEELEEKMQESQNDDASVDQTLSIFGGNSAQEELSMCSESTDASWSESEETSHSICSRSKTLLAFVAVEKRRASMSHLLSSPHSSPELVKRSQHRSPDLELKRRTSISYCAPSVDNTPELIKRSSTMDVVSQHNDFELNQIDSFNNFSSQIKFVHPPTPPRRSFVSKRRSDVAKRASFPPETSNEIKRRSINRRSFISQRGASSVKPSQSPPAGSRRSSHRRSYISQHRVSEINQRNCRSELHDSR